MLVNAKLITLAVKTEVVNINLIFMDFNFNIYYLL
jgi:hypothetical protein